MVSSVDATFRPVPFWAPRTLPALLLRPRLWHGVGHAPVSVAVLASGSPHPPPHQAIVRWSHDPEFHAGRLCIEFPHHDVYRRLAPRWRTLADSLHAMLGRRDAAFRNVAVDISDCEDGSVSGHVFRFARRKDERHELLPNVHLLGRRPRLPAPLPWDAKSDTIYFRGAATGDRSFATNKRVAACLAARDIGGGDCKLTAFPEVDQRFVDHALREGIAAPRAALAEMNRHRFLLDVDGNTSSWDRFHVIGSCGGVPIRFETEWEECWHHHLVEGVHFVAATRHTLADVVAELRANPQRARTIAGNAARIAREILSPQHVQRMLEEAWLRRTSSTD